MRAGVHKGTLRHSGLAIGSVEVRSAKDAGAARFRHPARAIANSSRGRHTPASELQPHDHHHRSVGGGGARAAVFGVSDGLVTNVSLVLGLAGAHPIVGVVRLAGLAGLIGGAFSMAAGEYVSMRAQRELLERELELGGARGGRSDRGRDDAHPGACS
jgi:hypothetical protein